MDGTGIAVLVVVFVFLTVIITALCYFYRKKIGCVWCSISQPLYADSYQLPPQEGSSLINDPHYALLETEFKQICTMDIAKTCLVAKQPNNTIKNRFRDILPYDENRVRIVSIGGDYINASHVSRKFVATQDPLPDQKAEFWNLLWQTQTQIVLRISGRTNECNTVEYLPELVDEECAFEGEEELKVTKKSLHHMGMTRVTKLVVEKSSEMRDIFHFHLTCWPQGTTPSMEDALQLITTSRRAHKIIGGIVTVHCCAGAGRTGTVIALWQLVDQMETGRNARVFDTVCTLRWERMSLVQTPEEYIFIHKCLEDFKKNQTKYPGMIMW